MIILSKRQKNILDFLESKKNHITINQISEHFEVSPRTVRNDLDSIEEFLTTYNIKLERKPKVGIKLILKNGQSVENMKNNHNISIYSSKDRALVVLLILIIKNKATIEALAEEVMVSRNTLVQDFKQLEKILSQYEITVSKKVYHGITIEGTEENVRSTFSVIYSKLPKELKADIKLRLLDSCKTTAESAGKIVEEIESKVGTLYSQESIEELECMILLSKIRSKTGNQVKCSLKDSELLKKRREFKILREILNSEDEEIFFILRLTDSSRRAVGGIVTDITDIILDDLCKTLQIERVTDLEFTSQMAMHLKVAISRIKNNLVIENPILDEIKYKMSFIYKITEQILQKREDDIGVKFPDEEIAYMAMYFDAIFEKSARSSFNSKILLVCNGGLATSSLLKARIESMVPEAELISICRLGDVEKVLSKGTVDFIVTTIPVNAKSHRVIRVNALLNNEDVEKIKSEIYNKKYEKKSKFLSKAVHVNEESEMKKLFPEEFTQLDVEIDDWKEAINMAAKPLLDSCKISKGYTKEIIKVIEKLGNYMVFIPKVAFVHATPEYVKENSMSIMTLKEEISFGSGTQVPVKVIVVLANKTENMYLVHLVNILTRGENVEKLKKATKYDDIVEIN